MRYSRFLIAILIATGLVGCAGDRPVQQTQVAPTAAPAEAPAPEELAQYYRYFHQAQFHFDDYLVEILRPKAFEQPMADRIEVYKGARRMILWRGNDILRGYDIGLGFSPTGPKWREGDGRTPEGSYVIDWRNPNSDYYLSLHISYPTPAQREEARQRGVPPGGAIMIHGAGVELASSRPRRGDWTDGCIAVTNAEIEEIWRLVPDGTPITIYP